MGPEVPKVWYSSLGEVEVTGRDEAWHLPLMSPVGGVNIPYFFDVQGLESASAPGGPEYVQ